MYIGNPYSVLGLKEDASIEECKKAYRVLCRKYHPDNSGDPDKYNAVVKAYKAIQSKEYTMGVVNINRHRLTHISLFKYAVV